MQYNSIPFESISCKEWANLLTLAATDKIILSSDSNLRISWVKSINELKATNTEELPLTKIYELTVQKFMQTKVDQRTLDLSLRSLGKIITKTQNSNLATSAAVATAKTVGWVTSKIPLIGSLAKNSASKTDEYLKDVEAKKMNAAEELKGLETYSADIIFAKFKTESFVEGVKKIVGDTQKNPLEKDAAAATLRAIKKEAVRTEPSDPEMLIQFKKDFSRDFCFTLVDPDNSDVSHKFFKGDPPGEVDGEERTKHVKNQLNALKSMLKTHPNDKKWFPIIQAACTQEMLGDLGQVKAGVSMLKAEDQDHFKWKDAKGYEHSIDTDHTIRFFVDIHRNPESQEIDSVEVKLIHPITIYAQSKKEGQAIKTKVDSSIQYALLYNLSFDDKGEIKVELKQREFY